MIQYTHSFINGFNLGIKPSDYYNDEKILSINGPVQSGKTMRLLFFVLLSISNGNNCIIVTQSNDMITYVMKSIDFINKEYNLHLQKMNKESNSYNPIRYTNSMGMKHWLNDNHTINCMIILGNKQQFKKIFDNTVGVDFHIFYDFDVSNFLQNDFIPLKSFWVNKQDLDGVYNIHFQLNPNYKGISSLRHNKIKNGIIEMIQTISTKNGPKTQNHPYICLGRLTKSKHKGLITQIQAEFYDKWMIIHGGNCHFSVQHHSFGMKSFKGCIKTLLTDIRHNFDTQTVSKIMIITSSVSLGLDFQDIDYCWHLTDQYCVSINNTKTLNILGSYSDNTHLDVWYK
jgi:hypothetical protein